MTARIYQGDCLEIMPSLPDANFDMILCDLPYGTTENHWDSPLPLDELWRQYKRLIKPNGVIVLTAQSPFDKILGASNMQMLRYEWIWEKSKATGFLNAKTHPLKAHENVLVFYERLPTYNPQMMPGLPYDKGIRKQGNGNGTYGEYKGAPIFNETGNRYPRSVIKFKTADAEGRIYHPTQKPIELTEFLIRTYTNVGDRILDNCMGSGTTLVAAEINNRDSVGIEKQADYVRIAEQRLAAIQPKLQFI